MKQLLRKYRYYLLALLVAAGLAANLPREWLFGQGEAERRSEVISAFLNLSVDPGAGGLSGVRMDWLVQARQLRERREARLAHVPEAVLAGYAEGLGRTEAEVRAVLTDPEQADPFEITGHDFGHVEDIAHGTQGPWRWGLVTAEREDEVEAPGQAMAGCGMWLVFWDEADWFYAPVGSGELNAVLEEAVPGLAGVAPGEAASC